MTVLTEFHCTLFQRRTCYVRDVFCGEVHNGGNEVVLDDDTSDCPPICSLLSEQQTDGFQGKLDRRGRVTHGTNLHKMLLLDGLYSCEKDSNLTLSVLNLKFKLSLQTSTAFVKGGFESLVVHRFDFPGWGFCLFLWSLRYSDAVIWKWSLNFNSSDLYYYSIK